MSPSFGESSTVWPYQAIRGWYLGKKREAAKRARYRFASLCDEEGVPDIPHIAGGKWIQCGFGVRNKPDMAYEVIRRNSRKLMRKRRTP